MKKFISALSSRSTILVDSILHALYAQTAITLRLQMAKIRELQDSFDPGDDDFDMLGAIVHDLRLSMLVCVKKEIVTISTQYEAEQLRMILSSIPYDTKHEKIRVKLEKKLLKLHKLPAPDVQQKIKKAHSVVQKVTHNNVQLFADGLHIARKGRGYAINFRQGGFIRKTQLLKKY